MSATERPSPPSSAVPSVPKVQHHVYAEETDWWCPADGRWSMCPGPCLDGTPHGPTRQVQVPVRLGPHPRPSQLTDPAPAVPCEWCGRAVRQDDAGRWFAVKGAERGYDPLACDASDDGTHNPPAKGPFDA